MNFLVPSDGERALAQGESGAGVGEEPAAAASSRDGLVLALEQKLQAKERMLATERQLRANTGDMEEKLEKLAEVTLTQKCEIERLLQEQPLCGRCKRRKAKRTGIPETFAASSDLDPDSDEDGDEGEVKEVQSCDEGSGRGPRLGAKAVIKFVCRHCRGIDRQGPGVSTPSVGGGPTEKEIAAKWAELDRAEDTLSNSRIELGDVLKLLETKRLELARAEERLGIAVDLEVQTSREASVSPEPLSQGKSDIPPLVQSAPKFGDPGPSSVESSPRIGSVQMDAIGENRLQMAMQSAKEDLENIHVRHEIAQVELNEKMSQLSGVNAEIAAAKVQLEAEQQEIRAAQEEKSMKEKQVMAVAHRLMELTKVFGDTLGDQEPSGSENVEPTDSSSRDDISFVVRELEKHVEKVKRRRETVRIQEQAVHAGGAVAEVGKELLAIERRRDDALRELALLETRLDEANACVSAMNDEVDASRLAKEGLEKEAESLREELRVLHSENDDMKRCVAETAQEISSLTDAVEEAKIMHESVSMAKSAIACQTDALPVHDAWLQTDVDSDEIDRVLLLAGKGSELQKEVDNLESACRQKKDTLSIYTEQHNSLKQQIEDSRKLLDSMMSNLAVSSRLQPGGIDRAEKEVEERVSEVKTLLVSHEREYASKSADLADLKREIESSGSQKADLEKERIAVARELAQLREATSLCQNEHGRLEIEVTNLRTVRSDLDSEISKQERKLGEVNVRLDEQSSLLLERSSRIEEMAQRASVLSAEISEKQESLVALEATRREMESDIAEVQSLLPEVQGDISSLSAERARLLEEKDGVMEMMDDVSRLELQKKKLTEDVRVAEEEARAIRTKRQEAEEACLSLRQEMNRQTEDLRMLRDEIHHYERVRQELANISAHSQNSSSAADISATAALNETLRKLTARLDESSRPPTVIQSPVPAPSQSSPSAADIQMQIEVSRLKDDGENMRRENARLKEDINQARHEIQRLNHTINESTRSIIENAAKKSSVEVPEISATPVRNNGYSGEAEYVARQRELMALDRVISLRQDELTKIENRIMKDQEEASAAAHHRAIAEAQLKEERACLRQAHDARAAARAEMDEISSACDAVHREIGFRREDLMRITTEKNAQVDILEGQLSSLISSVSVAQSELVNVQAAVASKQTELHVLSKQVLDISTQLSTESLAPSPQGSPPASPARSPLRKQGTKGTSASDNPAILKTEIDGLRRQQSAEEKAVKSLRRERETLGESISSLKERKAEVSLNLKATEDAVSRLNDEIVALKAQKEVAEKAAKAAPEKAMNEEEARMNALQDSIRELTSRRDLAAEEMKNKEAQLEGLKLEGSRRKAELDLLQDSLFALRSQVAAEQSGLEKVMKRLKGDIHDLEESKEIQNAQREEMERTVEGMKEEYSKLNSEIENMSQVHAAREEEYKRQIEESRAMLESLQNEARAKYNAELQEAKSRLDETHKKAQELEEEREHLRTSMVRDSEALLSHLFENRQELEKSIEEAQAELSELSEQKQASNGELHEMVSKVIEATTNLQQLQLELQRSQHQTVETSKQLSEKQALLAEIEQHLESKRADTVSQEKKHTECVAELTEARRLLSQTQADLSSLGKLVQEQSEYIKEQNGRLGEIAANISKGEKQVRENEARASGLEEKISSLQHESTRLHELRATASTAASHAEERLADVNAALREKERALAQHEDECKALQTRATRLAEDVAEMDGQKKNLSKELAEVTSSLPELQKSLVSLSEHKAELEEECAEKTEEMKRSIEDLRAQHVAVSEEIDAKVEEKRQEAHKKISELEAEVVRSREEKFTSLEDEMAAATLREKENLLAVVFQQEETEGKVQEARAILASVKDDIATEKLRKEAVAADVEELQGKIVQLARVIGSESSLSNDVGGVMSEVHRLENEALQRRSEVRRAEADFDDLVRRCADKRHELEEISFELTSRTRVLDDTKKSVAFNETLIAESEAKRAKILKECDSIRERAEAADSKASEAERRVALHSDEASKINSAMNYVLSALSIDSPSSVRDLHSARLAAEAIVSSVRAQAKIYEGKVGDLNRLESLAKVANEEVAKAESRRMDAEEKQRVAEANVERAEAKLLKIDGDVEGARSTLREVTEKRNLMEDELAAKSRQLQATKEQITAVTEAVQQASSLKETLENRIAELKSSIEFMKNETESLSTKEGRLRTVEARLEKISRDVEVMEERDASLRSDLAKKESRVRECNETIQETSQLETELAQVMTKKDLVESEVAAQSSVLASLQNEVMEAQLNIDDRRRELEMVEKALHDGEAQLSGIRKESKNLEESIEMNRGVMDALREELARERRELDTLIQRRNDPELVSALVGLESVKSSVTEARDNMEVLRKEIDTITVEKEELVGEVAVLRAQKESLDKETMESAKYLSEGNAQLNEIMIDIAKKSAELEGIDREHATKKESFEVQAVDYVNRMEGAVKNTLGHLGNLQKEIEEAIDKLHSTEGELDAKSKALEIAVSSLERAERERGEVEAELAEKSARLEEVRSSLNIDESAIKEKEETVHRLDRNISDQKTILEAVSKEIQSRSTSLNEVVGRLEGKKDALKSTEKALDEAGEKLERRRRQYKEWEQGAEETSRMMKEDLVCTRIELEQAQRSSRTEAVQTRQLLMNLKKDLQNLAERKDAEIIDFEKARDGLRAELEGMYQENAMAEAQLEEMRSRLRETKADLVEAGLAREDDDPKSFLPIERVSAVILKSRAETLSREAAMWKAEHERVAQQLAEQQTKLESIVEERDSFERVSRENTHWKDEYSRLLHTVNALNAETESLRAHKEHLTVPVDKFRKSSESFQVAVEAQNQTIAKLHEENSYLKAEFERYKDSCEKLEKDLAWLTTENTELKGKVEELIAENEHLKAGIQDQSEGDGEGVTESDFKMMKERVDGLSKLQEQLAAQEKVISGLSESLAQEKAKAAMYRAHDPFRQSVESLDSVVLSEAPREQVRDYTQTLEETLRGMKAEKTMLDERILRDQELIRTLLQKQETATGSDRSEFIRILEDQAKTSHALVDELRGERDKLRDTILDLKKDFDEHMSLSQTRIDRESSEDSADLSALKQEYDSMISQYKKQSQFYTVVNHLKDSKIEELEGKLRGFASATAATSTRSRGVSRSPAATSPHPHSTHSGSRSTSVRR